MKNYSYFDGKGREFTALSEARKEVRKALRIDPGSVRHIDYWDESSRRIKVAYVKRVSPSGKVKYFGIY